MRRFLKGLKGSKWLLAAFLFSAFFAVGFLDVRAETGGGMISGKFADQDGRTIIIENAADFRVFAYKPDTATLAEGIVMRDGSYRISLPPFSLDESAAWIIGTEINPQSGFSSSVMEEIAFRTDRTATHIVKLNRIAGAIFGKVSRSNGFLGNAVVNLSRLFGDRTAISSGVDASGAYQFFVAAGKYLVSAFAAPQDNVVNPVATEVNVGSGEIINVISNFKDPTGVIKGAVSAVDGSDVFDAAVAAWSDEGYTSETRTGKNGNYLLKVNDGNWHVRVSKTIGRKIYRSSVAAVSVHGSTEVKNISMTAEGFLPPAESVVFRGEKGTVVELSDGARVIVPFGALPADSYTIKFEAYNDEVPPSLGRRITGPAYRAAIYGSDGQIIDAPLLKSALIEIPYPSGGIRSASVINLLNILFRDPLSSAWRYASTAFFHQGRGVVISSTRYLASFVGTEPALPPSEPEAPPAPEPEPEPLAPAPAPATTPVTSPPSSGGGGGGGGGGTTDNTGSDNSDTGTSPGGTDSGSENTTSGITPPRLTLAAGSLPGGIAVLTSDTLVRTVTVCVQTANQSVVARTENQNPTNLIILDPSSGFRPALEKSVPYLCTVTAIDANANSSIKTLTLTAPAPVPSTVPARTATASFVLPSDFPAIFRFSQNMNIGFIGIDALYLQKFLNVLPCCKVAEIGSGSPGNEIQRYGPLTAAAVRKFQQKYLAAVLAAQGIPNGTNNVGKATRGAINEILSGTLAP